MLAKVTKDYVAWWSKPLVIGLGFVTLIVLWYYSK